MHLILVFLLCPNTFKLVTLGEPGFLSGQNTCVGFLLLLFVCIYGFFI